MFQRDCTDACGTGVLGDFVRCFKDNALMTMVLMFCFQVKLAHSTLQPA